MNPFQQSAQYFPTLLQQTVYLDKYSRYDWGLGRREAWVETVERSVNFLRELSHNRLSPEDYNFVQEHILNLAAMPSMRLLASAGEAARRQNVAICNCSYLPLDSIDAFVEVMLLSMNGTGVGYSVERSYVEQLPVVARQTGKVHYDLIDDSTEGWCNALRFALECWFRGEDVEYNYDLIRPAGAILRVKGGRASGPEPLKKALNHIRWIILARQGRKLRPIDAHDIACHIAAASISGGVRRSALISLFDASDTTMLNCKAGEFWDSAPQRMYANNSAVIGDHTDERHIESLLRQMEANGTGEPGLFNRDGVRRMRPERRADAKFGLNPCGEIALRPMQTCNLSSAVCRAEDTFEDLERKVRAATIIGTIQAMADNFPGLRPEWRRNQQEERLLGVDLSGQMDCPLVQEPWVQECLKTVALNTNDEYAKKLGITPSAGITTVKPSGNSGQLLNASSGLHARWSPYYIRHVRLNAHSPVRRLLAGQGVPMSPEVGQEPETANTWVVPFPVKSPEGATFRNDRTAIQQLQYVQQVRTCWTEHQPSVTITYRPEEMEDIIEWVQENKDYVAGLSFLRASDHVYQLPPYTEVDQAEYERVQASFPEIVDFSLVADYEAEDMTTATGELACSAGGCELL